MRTIVTSRHFKAHESLTSYAEDAVSTLQKYYDGIINADVILSYERARNSTKIAEITIHVHNALLSGRAASDDFFKAVDGSVQKLQIQLKRYKEKKRNRDRKDIRRIQARV